MRAVGMEKEESTPGDGDLSNPDCAAVVPALDPPPGQSGAGPLLLYQNPEVCSRHICFILQRSRFYLLI